VRQPKAVGGQGEFVQGAVVQAAGQRTEQIDNTLAYQGLSAGDAQLFHSTRDEEPGDSIQLLDRQQLRARMKLHVFGHAVDAA
jgi:hypothetical protein